MNKTHTDTHTQKLYNINNKYAYIQKMIDTQIIYFFFFFTLLSIFTLMFLN